MAKLHFYYSAMNAGKSTTLLQSDYNYREVGMTTLLFTPSFDDRYEKNHITSRIGIKAPAHGFDKHFDFLEFVKAHQKSTKDTLACILVDEAHFLNKAQVEQLTLIVDYLNIPVLTYGLRTDFKGEPFEGSKYLLAWAESLTEIKTICHCGKKAIMNIRIDETGNKVVDGAQIDIGGSEKYVSTCRRHFIEGDGSTSQTKESDD